MYEYTTSIRSRIATAGARSWIGVHLEGDVRIASVIRNSHYYYNIDNILNIGNNENGPNSIMVTYKDAPLNLKAYEYARPVNDHDAYALDLDGLFNEAATTENPASLYIPSKFLTDVAQPVVLALLAAGGNQIIPGVDYDPTSAPKLVIDGSGNELFLVDGNWVRAPVLKISGVKVNVDTTIIPPDTYPALSRPLLTRVKFQGPVTLNELKLINDPKTGRLIIPQNPDVTAVHQNIGKQGYVTSATIANFLPSLLNPQGRLEELAQTQLDAATVANGVAPKKVKSAGLEIIGDPQSTPELSGLRLTLQTTR